MIRSETLKALEFDKVLALIAGFAKSSAGREDILEITPLSNREDIERRASEVGEIRSLYVQKTPLDISRFEDIYDPVERLRPEGAMIDGLDFLAIKSVLEVIDAISTQMKGRDDLPLLGELTEAMEGFPDILKLLNRTFDMKGDVLDKATPELSAIRKKLRGMRGRIGNRLEEIVRDEKISPFLQDDFITTRGERWVIPVRMDAKGQVAGVVHDVSNSGETAFVEPLEIIGLVNELENLVAEEKAEVLRIIRKVCKAVRSVLPDMEREYKILVYLDLLNGIAAFALNFEFGPVLINDTRQIVLNKARHPLLVVQAREGDIKDAVPLNMTIEGENSVMVITGPNAGGKTITIKTVGLLLLMTLSGVPVPADASSMLPIASNLLVDIGDEQSIESSHSTFSAHISRISKIIGEADKDTIVLLDEVGTGTEPVQGSALACGVLNELRERGALVLATTHLTDIVAFVQKSKGMKNASMEFDGDRHTPLYRLKDGEPGQSHAIAMASRYGLPDGVIAFAKDMMGGQNVELQELMAELNEKRVAYEEAKDELVKREKGIKLAEEDIQNRLDEAKAKKKKAYSEAYEDAKDLIINAKREIREIIEEGKKGKKKEALKKLEKRRLDVVSKIDEISGVKDLLPEAIKAGDTVFVRSIGYDARVKEIDLKGGRITVESGGITIEAALADVSEESGKAARGKRNLSNNIKHSDIAASSIKLIGLRVDEALDRLQDFVDSASIAGLYEIKIIHGVGTGALMKAVRAYLENHPNVSSFKQGLQAEGGAGVTIATMS